MAPRNETENIKRFLDDLWKQAQSMLGGGKKAKNAVNAAQVKMDLYLLNTRRDDLYRKLGEAFYSSARRKNPAAKKVDAITTVMQEIREIDAHEKGLKKAARKKPRKATEPSARRGRPPGRKTAGKRGRPRKAAPASKAPKAPGASKATRKFKAARAPKAPAAGTAASA
jgi:hypothetical protein